MSNRRRSGTVRIARQDARRAARCPDCDSDVRIRRWEPGRLAHIEVHHSDGCPWFRARGEHRLVRLLPSGTIT
ncbi:MAG: hypothetical protein QOI06_227 [Nocardioidaceae bacterium]|nr:hypothetical protein [Nocardioidaceae bacterium]